MVTLAINDDKGLSWLITIITRLTWLLTTTNNLTFIRSYATQAHGHKPYIQIHNTVINWKTQHTRTCQNKQKKTLYVQTEILRKNLIIHLNRFDYSQLHFCFQHFYQKYFVQGNYIICSKRFYNFIHRWSSIVISRYILRSQVMISITNDHKMVLVLEWPIVICTIITMSLISWDIPMSSIFNQQVMWRKSNVCNILSEFNIWNCKKVLWNSKRFEIFEHKHCWTGSNTSSPLSDKCVFQSLF